MVLRVPDLIIKVTTSLTMADSSYMRAAKGISDSSIFEGAGVDACSRGVTLVYNSNKAEIDPTSPWWRC